MVRSRMSVGASASDIIVVGTGGIGREVAVLIEAVNRAAAAPPWRLLGYADADPRRAGERLGAHEVLGGDDYVLGIGREVAVVVAIGWPGLLAAAHRRYDDAAHVTRPSLRHPTAVLDGDVRLGPGVVVAAGAVLTTDIAVGAHSILNLQVTVGHDAVIGEDCVLGPGRARERRSQCRRPLPAGLGSGDPAGRDDRRRRGRGRRSRRHPGRRGRRHGDGRAGSAAPVNTVRPGVARCS